MTLTENQEQEVKKVARIAAPIFRAENWKWATSNTEDRVPSVDEIIQYLTEQVVRMTSWDKTLSSVASGRFRFVNYTPHFVGISLELGAVPYE